MQKDDVLFFVTGIINTFLVHVKVRHWPEKSGSGIGIASDVVVPGFVN